MLSAEQLAQLFADREQMRQVIDAFNKAQTLRTETLRFTVTPGELADVKLKADEAHMNLSDFIRSKIWAQDTSKHPENGAK